MRIKLLPDDPDVGKAPYFWLLYLVFFIAPYCLEWTGWLALARAGLVVLLFLLLYFRNYWLDGAALWRNALAITALGVIMAPSNDGASVFFIYSACAAAGFARERDGLLLIAGNALVGSILALLGHTGWNFWLLAVVFPVVIGGSALYGGQISRVRSKLLRKQDEITHLTKIAERERIARDMHDVLGHSLSVVVLKSELARRLIPTDPERAMREIEDVETAARQALTQVREVISGYRSAGWAAEIAQAQRVLEAAGIALDLDESPVNLPPAVENVLSLALREAVTNIVRHAAATCCAVRLGHDGNDLLCEISDNGVGTESLQRGHGLRGMRERIEALGGAIHLASNQSGLQLRITLPFG